MSLIDHILDYDSESLSQRLKKMGMPSYLVNQIFDWIYCKRIFDIDQWSNISLTNREKLKSEFSFSIPKIVWNSTSKDGTTKFLIGFKDGHQVEMVIISSLKRRTLCLSSQVGCAIGCTFCHTGTQGLTRNLSTHEVVLQFLLASSWLKDDEGSESKISNIVYMGMGEPLHNFENMKMATKIFLDPKGLGLGQRRITLSTSGLVPQIEKLDEFPPVNIAISLHSANDEVRSELMPLNRAYDIKRLFQAIEKIPLKAFRRITYEYILIRDLNDSEEDIRALVSLLNKKESKVNIIPFNEFPGSRFKKPADALVEWFCESLNKRGLVATVRVTKGDDILAACGQLKSLATKKPSKLPGFSSIES
ncbi:MAG: 23S rRNA (adenine(2503)-C(2))-methyltransferase RlmN [Bacteriovoracaceae bacterium]|nr:23S rRNA (adenine(2503)-C(2))-methyltransferase RlmN [Bacteriovoracaceae bacterium]